MKVGARGHPPEEPGARRNILEKEPCRLHHWTKKLRNTWGELVFALLESFPVALLVLAALYAGLELLTLPGKYERIGPKLIFALLILILFYFPAKVVILFCAAWVGSSRGWSRWHSPPHSSSAR